MQQWKIHREVRYKLDKLTFQTFVIDHLLGMHLFASLHFDIISIFLFTSQYFLSDFQLSKACTDTARLPLQSRTVQCYFLNQPV